MCERVSERIALVGSPSELDELGQGMLVRDGIAMAIVGIGDHIRRIERTWPGVLKAHDATVDWKLAVGMRDRIAHGYTTIDSQVVYLAATQSVPALETSLRALLPRLVGPAEPLA